MKNIIRNLLLQSLKTLVPIAEIDKLSFVIEYSRDPSHGDFASNIALIMAKNMKCNPRELADKIVSNIPESDVIKKTEIAGPGFINFFIKTDAYHFVISEIFNKGKHYGDSNIGRGVSTLVEFVSANPTGPLHIGHGRGAAYGAVVSNLLTKTGFKVCREYYVNDAGRQMNILAISVWLRYLQKCNISLSFPENAYKGDYILDIVQKIHNDHGEIFLVGSDKLPSILEIEDSEKKLDKLIGYCKQVLGEKNYLIIFNTSLNSILCEIKKDLQDFGVEYDNWFSELSLIKNNKILKCIEQLDKNGWVYKKNGATWFRSSKLGDEKDRVLIRDNSEPTYFASDIAYHLNKKERGFEKIINIWGADHHGYIARLKSSMQALGGSPKSLEVLLVQFANLWRGKEKLQMSTRKGEFITLKELQNEVGKSATRFFYIMRKSEQHLDFDLELAKSETKNNPVFYIQYTHARICSVFRRMLEKNLYYNKNEALKGISILINPTEIMLLSSLIKYPEIIENAATSYEPHQLAYYLKDLSNNFHTYYDCKDTPFLVADNKVRNARLALIDATRCVIKNGLELLGIEALEIM